MVIFITSETNLKRKQLFPHATLLAALGMLIPNQQIHSSSSFFFFFSFAKSAEKPWGG